MRLIRLFGAIFVISVKREIAFRANFVISGVQTVIMTAAGLVTIGVVFQQTTQLGGWSLGEALVLLGTFQIMSGVLMTFIEPNVRWFAEGVQRGRLDDTLLKPVSSLFLATLGSHAPFGLVQVALGTALIVFGHRVIGEAPGLWNIAGWLAMMVAGVAITWATRVGLVIVALWAPSFSLDVVYDAVWQFARYPVTIYEQPLRIMLSWVIPLVFISTLPALALTKGLGGVALLAGVVTGVAVVVLVQRAWKFGLKRYTSATS